MHSRAFALPDAPCPSSYSVFRTGRVGLLLALILSCVALFVLGSISSPSSSGYGGGSPYEQPQSSYWVNAFRRQLAESSSPLDWHEVSATERTVQDTANAENEERCAKNAAPLLTAEQAAELVPLEERQARGICFTFEQEAPVNNFVSRALKLNDFENRPPMTRCVPRSDHNDDVGGRKRATGIVETRIPRRMMQTSLRDWVPRRMRLAMESWIRRNPDYGYEYFDDGKARRYIVAHYSRDVVGAFDVVVPGAYKADLFRLLWLFHSGGVFVDVDSYAGVPLSEVVNPSDGFFSVLVPNSNYIFQALIGSEPRHPFLRKAIDVALRLIMRRGYVKGDTFVTSFHGVAGPGLLHVLLRRHLGVQTLDFGRVESAKITLLRQSASLPKDRKECPDRGYVIPHINRTDGEPQTIFWNRYVDSLLDSGLYYNKKSASYTSLWGDRKVYNASYSTASPVSDVLATRRLDGAYMSLSPSKLSNSLFPKSLAGQEQMGVVADTVLVKTSCWWAPAFDRRFDTVAREVSSEVGSAHEAATFLFSVEMTNCDGSPSAGRTSGGCVSVPVGCVLVFEGRRDDHFAYDDLELIVDGRSFVAPNDGSRVFAFRDISGVKIAGGYQMTNLTLRPVFWVDHISVAEVALFRDPTCQGAALNVANTIEPDCPSRGRLLRTVVALVLLALVVGGLGRFVARRFRTNH